jgi:hypothetical protein
MAVTAKRTTVADLREELVRRDLSLELLTERLAELELALEDVGWQKLGGDNEREFSREGLRKICQLSRYMYLKNPLINRAVNVQAHYVWAQGVTLKAIDEGVNKVVQAFLDDRANQTELTSHQARTLKEVELQVLGNLFFVFFVSAADGAVKVRTIPADEVVEILTNPEDAKEPWFYKRTWTERSLDGGTRQRTAYYPDWRKPASVSFQPSNGEVLDFPVYHVKVGGLSDMRFGVPETYQALDWAKAYKEFLEDRATIARALSRFAWRLTTPGGKQGVAAARTKLATTLGTSTSETNPPPTVGAAFVASQNGAALDPIRTAGATINPEEGRHFLLMVCAAFGLPETFFGDVSVGTLATATSLDRPTELKMLDRRTLWADVLKDILQFVIDRAVAAGALAEGVDRSVDVDFPSLLEHDPVKRIASIIDAATLKGQTSVGTMDDRTLISLLLQALGVDDVDALLDKLAPEGGESLIAQLARERQEQAQAIADQQAQARQDQEDDEDDPQREAFVEAVEELRGALVKLQEGTVGQ